MLLPSGRFTYTFFRSLSSAAHNFLHLLSHLYAQRSSPLWKDSKRASWFASTVASVVLRADWNQVRRKNLFEFYKPIGPRYSAYRQITILETSYRNLFAFIPREILNVKQLACDPLPPPTATNSYDAIFFKGVDDVFSIRHRTRRDAAGDQRLLERLIPDPVFLRQLQVCNYYFISVPPSLAEKLQRRHSSMHILGLLKGSQVGSSSSHRWQEKCLKRLWRTS